MRHACGLKAKIMIAVFVIIVASSGFVWARSVTMNLAFKIGSDKSDTIYVNGTSFFGSQSVEKNYSVMDKKYISSERDGKVLAMIFSGDEFMDTILSTSYSSNAYLIGMKQNSYRNRFVIGFTNGTYNNIDGKAKDVETVGFLAKNFGNFVFASPEKFPLYIRLEYANADIIGRTIFEGPTKLFIKNNGKIGDIFNISVSVL